MANALANIARVYTASIGTGNITLGNAVPGYVRFDEGGLTDGQTCSYGIQIYNVNGTLNASEVGSATYNLGSQTLTNRTPVTSTNSNNAIPLIGDATRQQVFITATASDIGGAGTVTSFSAGNLSPLFTTSVATATTTPALSFSLSNAGANTYFGNATGGSAAPSFTAAGALTKVDDTNVTLTLGGSPTTALLGSTSLTLGWTGVLSAARGGTGGTAGAANPALSNLASVAINTSLLPGSNDGAALGSGTFAFSDAYLASGGIINWNNGNYTITHSAGLLTFAGRIAATSTSVPLTLTNTTDGASVQVARFDGDRATPANNDTGYVSMYLSDTAGAQTEFARMSWLAQDAAPGTPDGQLIFGVSTAGTLTDHVALSINSWRPSTNDTHALGSSTIAWSDLYLATGALIDFGSGNSVITHSSGILTVSTGDLRVTTAGTNTASVVTVGGTQTLTNKTLTSPTLTTPALGTPASGTLTNCTGLPISSGVSGLGTGVATMLASATGAVVALPYIIDGGGATITTGNKYGIYIPFSCTITGWNIGLDQSGSIVIDIWKDTQANYPPTVADTITASAKPTVTTATNASSTTLTGWTTTVAAGNWLFFNVDSVTSATWCNITLTVTKT